MKKILFATLTLAALAFSACTSDGGKEYTSSTYVDSLMAFEYKLTGDVLSYVNIKAECDIPAANGKVSVIKPEPGVVTVNVSKIKCPTKFNITVKITPKQVNSFESEKSYTLGQSAVFSVFRLFEDGSYVSAGDGESSTEDTYYSGKELNTTFEKGTEIVFPFTFTADGYIDETPSED